MDHPVVAAVREFVDAEVQTMRLASREE